MVPGEGRLPATKVMEHLVKKQESFGVNYKTDKIAGTLDAFQLLGKKIFLPCLADPKLKTPQWNC